MTTMQLPQQISQQMQHCIQRCLECHSVCLSTLYAYCLEAGGHHAKAEHVRLMSDCAEMCQTSANFMLRGSELHVRTCGVCAEICDRCATDCGLFEDDEQMQNCAEVCRRCAESCREMAMTKA
ncbi:MAG: four-helix bundle copper-binding protein [Xenococcaceae cyanobacterium]